MNATEAGYQPQGAQPRDFTDFEQVITGFDPIVADWEDSVHFPFDGTMDQRHKGANKVKVSDIQGTREEKEDIIPLGSVFQYEDGTEFRLDRLWWDYKSSTFIKAPKGIKIEENNEEGRWETDEEYQGRFQYELGKELDRLSKIKKKDKWGREYYEQMHSKHYVKKYQVGRYYAAYFLTDETSLAVKSWFGNEALQKMGLQKRITLLVLNTDTKEVFSGAKAEGFIGNVLSLIGLINIPCVYGEFLNMTLLMTSIIVLRMKDIREKDGEEVCYQ